MTSHRWFLLGIAALASAGVANADWGKTPLGLSLRIEPKEKTVASGSDVIVVAIVTNVSEKPILVGYSCPSANFSVEIHVGGNPWSLRPAASNSVEVCASSDLPSLDPGKSVTTEVDVSAHYDLTAPQQYSIRLAYGDRTVSNSVVVTVSPAPDNPTIAKVANNLYRCAKITRECPTAISCSK